LYFSTPNLLTPLLSAWDEIHQVFGDGNDYAWALEDDNEYDEEIQQQKLDMKYTDVCATSLIYLRGPLTFH
jgi:transcription elongation factor SPT6